MELCSVLLLITEKGESTAVTVDGAYVVCAEGNCRASNIICPLVASHIGIMKLNIHIAHTPRCTAFTICTCRTQFDYQFQATANPPFKIIRHND